MTPDPLNNEVPSRLPISRRARRIMIAAAFVALVVASVPGGAAAAPAPAPPVISAESSATFTVGLPGTVNVTATGTPTPAIAAVGALPAGVTLVDGGNGSATLSGTPQPGTGGVYEVLLTASNGVSPNAAQAFTLTVEEAPAFDSQSSATFTVSQAESMMVLVAGFPVPMVTETGSLPRGLSFSSNATGAIISGTPAPGSQGAHRLTIVAANGISPSASQAFTLTVGAAPPRKPSNQFTVTNVGVGRNGTVAFDLTVPGAGAVNVMVSAAGIRRHWRRHLNPTRAESTRVRVRVAVNPKHRPVTLAVTYKPSGGTARTVRIKGLQVP